VKGHGNGDGTKAVSLMERPLNKRIGLWLKRAKRNIPPFFSTRNQHVLSFCPVFPIIGGHSTQKLAYANISGSLKKCEMMIASMMNDSVVL
jgi:hypothetical protein